MYVYEIYSRTSSSRRACNSLQARIFGCAGIWFCHPTKHVSGSRRNLGSGGGYLKPEPCFVLQPNYTWLRLLNLLKKFFT